MPLWKPVFPHGGAPFPVFKQYLHKHPSTNDCRSIPCSWENLRMKSNSSISNHILPTSATMVGICITVISIIRLTELSAKVTTVVDIVMFVDSVLFMISCILSYISLRSISVSQSLERWADMVFLAGLVLMVFGSFLLAWEFGKHDLQNTKPGLVSYSAQPNSPLR